MLFACVCVCIQQNELKMIYLFFKNYCYNKEKDNKI